MGRAKIFGLLAKLEENRQKQAIVDSAIFTVAQVAVNELRDRVNDHERKVNQPLLESGDDDLTPTWEEIWEGYDRMK